MVGSGEVVWYKFVLMTLGRGWQLSVILLLFAQVLSDFASSNLATLSATEIQALSSACSPSYVRFCIVPVHESKVAISNFGMEQGVYTVYG